MEILSGGPLFSASCRQREWIFVQKCLLERKRSYLTEKGLFSRKVVKAAAPEPINFIKEESHGTQSTPHRHRTRFARQGRRRDRRAPCRHRRGGAGRHLAR